MHFFSLHSILIAAGILNIRCLLIKHSFWPQRQVFNNLPQIRYNERFHILINPLLHSSKLSTQSSMAELIDGNAVAAAVRGELKESVRILQETLGVTPGLAVVLVGERRDSATYVRMKKKACAEIGINSIGIDYPATVSEEELIAKIDELNNGKHIFYSYTLVYLEYLKRFCFFVP
jgi:hypothetical protein